MYSFEALFVYTDLAYLRVLVEFRLGVPPVLRLISGFSRVNWLFGCAHMRSECLNVRDCGLGCEISI